MQNYARYIVNHSQPIAYSEQATARVTEHLHKMLSYRRETALQGTLVLAESGRLELRDNILLIL